MKQRQLSVPSGGEHRHHPNFKVVHTLEMYIVCQNRAEGSLFLFNFEHFFFQNLGLF